MQLLAPDILEDARELSVGVLIAALVIVAVPATSFRMLSFACSPIVPGGGDERERALQESPTSRRCGFMHDVMRLWPDLILPHRRCFHGSGSFLKKFP